MKQSKQMNGTSYDVRTPNEVVRILGQARQNRTRLHVSLGETEGPESGRDWLEENDVYGFIGRSTGSVKIPLLIHNRRSLGGPGLLDHCVVRIRYTTGRRAVVWQQGSYHHGKIEIRRKAEPIVLPDGRTLHVDVVRDGQVQAAFEDVKARRYIHKLGVQAEIVA